MPNPENALPLDLSERLMKTGVAPDVGREATAL